MIHLYCGDGKGKTTAAMGLALRATGHGWPVCVVQFLKDGTSGEAAQLARLPHVTLLACEPGITFSFRMTEGQRAAAKSEHDRNLARATELMRQGKARLVVLDEACAALSAGLVSEESLRQALDTAREVSPEVELALTGRDPAPWLLDEADYVTEMRCLKHPYERGIMAREGVEW